VKLFKVVFCLAAVSAFGFTSPAAEVVSASGIQGGMCVLLGPPNTALASTLHQGGPFQVHIWNGDTAAINSARLAVKSLGIYGPVSAECGRQDSLPYSENLVNLVVADPLPSGLGLGEILRVLTPGGAVLVKGASTGELTTAGFTGVTTAGGWTKGVKPRPGGMDEWTHTKCNASGNPISGDTLIGPPARLQWLDSPAWMGHIEGLHGEVSANGRVFYINPYPTLTLMARDAFNGTILWQKPITAKSALVAEGNYLYTVLNNAGGYVCRIDGATGDVLLNYTQGAAVSGEVRLLYWNDTLMINNGNYIRTVDPATGTLYWATNVGSSPNYNIIVANDTKIIFNSRGWYTLRILNKSDGQILWKTDNTRDILGVIGKLHFVLEDVFVMSDGSFSGQYIYGVSTEKDSLMWRAAAPQGGHSHGDVNIFYANGMIWHEEVRDGSKASGWTGINPLTGEAQTTFLYNGGMQMTPGRCFAYTAAGNKVIMGDDWVADLRTGTLTQSKFVRDGCSTGPMPANGLIYSFPHGCWCANWLRGIAATAPSGSGPVVYPSGDPVLEQGPAFGQSGNPVNADDWPTFRCNAARSGATAAQVSANLKPLWTRAVGDALTGPTSANGRVFVAGDLRVVALSAADGSVIWDFVAGGRVDSPPTIYRGLCIFGSADGWVYCLDAATGQLAWRLRAAPYDRRIVSYRRLSSHWPVHGCVLVDSGIVYTAAGFHSELDEGIRVIAANAVTGQLVWQQRLQGLGDPVNNDIMMAGNGRVYMNRSSFIPASGQYEARRPPLYCGLDGRNSLMFSTSQWNTGLENYGDSYSRTAWHYGSVASGGILVFDGSQAWGLNENSTKSEPVVYTRSAWGTGPQTWSVPVSFAANSIVRAGQTVFISGGAGSSGDSGGLVVALSAADGSEAGRVVLGTAPTVPEGLAAAGNRLFASTRDGKVVCLAPSTVQSRTADREQFRYFIKARPNPFNPVLNIHYQLRKSGVVDLNVFDLKGHLVTRLYHGAKKAGSHRMSWHARASGHKGNVASGYYYLILKVNGKRMVLPVLLVK
jgi:outer membrane protein assembly factor BamB